MANVGGELVTLMRPSRKEPGRRPGFLFAGGMRPARGFTLTELIVAIVVAGILAAVKAGA